MLMPTTLALTSLMPEKVVEAPDTAVGVAGVGDTVGAAGGLVPDFCT